MDLVSLLEFSQFDLRVIHWSGKTHQNVDGLSSIPDAISDCKWYNAGKDLKTLPCGGCAFSKQAVEQWSKFHDQVDDVIPMQFEKLPVQTDCPTCQGKI